MVQSIEQYGDVLKVILKPTSKFPVGRNYFYCDASARELVEAHCWFLEVRNYTTYVIRHDDTATKKGTIRFHAELLNSNERGVVTVDHLSHNGLDNRSCNLRVTTCSENNYNKPNKNYHRVAKDGHFWVRLHIDGKTRSISHNRNEFEAVKSAYIASTKYFGENCYNFLLDRNGDTDILNDELTGKITAEEATFRHVMRYAKDNAWYVYRYGLEDYFNSRGIQIPAFELDSQGYMIDVNTKERLCPFK